MLLHHACLVCWSMKISHHFLAYVKLLLRNPVNVDHFGALCLQSVHTNMQCNIRHKRFNALSGMVVVCTAEGHTMYVPCLLQGNICEDYGMRFKKNHHPAVHWFVYSLSRLSLLPPFVCLGGGSHQLFLAAHTRPVTPNVCDLLRNFFFFEA